MQGPQMISLETLTIFSLIAVFSIVQSIFGMGILVFGTPTLMLLGLDFIPTLQYLLPASLTVSALQIITSHKHRVPISKNLYLACLPAIAFGLWLTVKPELSSRIQYLVGVLLLASALVREVDIANRWIIAFILRFELMFQFCMGIVHGLTNLGGAFLALYSGSQQVKKNKVRYVIAYYYLAFGIIQVSTLVYLGHMEGLATNLATAAISATVYLTLGNRLFQNGNNLGYQRGLSLFVAVYGAVILMR
jgi:uncharacterized protein